jgi:hypothetical protein
MFKSLGVAVALTLLAGCASWFDDRPARAARHQPGAQAQAVEAEMRARLDVLRRQPDLASDELIRELEAFLRERERARLARVNRGAASVAALPAPAAAPVAPAAAPVAPVVSVTPLPQAAAPARARPPVPERAAPAAAVATVRPIVVAPAAPAPTVAPAEPAFVAAPGTTSLAEAQALFARARLLEDERQVGRAVPLYTHASRQGLVAASVRLMELYTSGAEGLTRNYLAAVRFKDLALQQGAKLDNLNRR